MKKVFIPLLICLVFLFSSCDPAIDAKPEDNAKIEAVVKALGQETPYPSESIVSYDTKFTDFALEEGSPDVKLRGTVSQTVNGIDENEMVYNFKGDFTLSGASGDNSSLNGRYVFEMSGKGENVEKQNLTKDGEKFGTDSEYYQLVSNVIREATASDNYQSDGFSMTITLNTTLRYSGEVKGTVKQVSKMSVNDGSVSGTVNVDVTYKTDAVKATINIAGKEAVDNIEITEISLNGKPLKPGSISSEVKNSIKTLLNSENPSI